MESLKNSKEVSVSGDIEASRRVAPDEFTDSQGLDYLGLFRRLLKDRKLLGSSEHLHFKKDYGGCIKNLQRDKSRSKMIRQEVIVV